MAKNNLGQSKVFHHLQNRVAVETSEVLSVIMQNYERITSSELTPYHNYTCNRSHEVREAGKK